MRDFEVSSSRPLVLYLMFSPRARQESRLQPPGDISSPDYVHAKGETSVPATQARIIGSGKKEKESSVARRHVCVQGTETFQPSVVADGSSTLWLG